MGRRIQTRTRSEENGIFYANQSLELFSGAQKKWALRFAVIGNLLVGSVAKLVGRPGETFPPHFFFGIRVTRAILDAVIPSPPPVFCKSLASASLFSLA